MKIFFMVLGCRYCICGILLGLQIYRIRLLRIFPAPTTKRAIRPHPSRGGCLGIARVLPQRPTDLRNRMRAGGMVRYIARRVRAQVTGIENMSLSVLMARMRNLFPDLRATHVIDLKGFVLFNGRKYPHRLYVYEF